LHFSVRPPPALAPPPGRPAGSATETPGRVPSSTAMAPPSDASTPAPPERPLIAVGPTHSPSIHTTRGLGTHAPSRRTRIPCGAVRDFTADHGPSPIADLARTRK